MDLKSPLLSIFLAVQFCLASSVQGQNIVRGEFVNLKFDAFVSALEEKTPYRFYYNPIQTDSLIVNLSIENKKIEEVLNQLFAGTDLHYTLDGTTVYVTKGRAILAELPIDFFNQGSTANPGQRDFDFSAYEKAEAQNKQIESKLYFIGTKTNNLQGEAVINGMIRDQKTGEPIIGATVFIENPRRGTATDPFGHYSFSLPKGKHELKFSSIGMKNASRQIMLYSDGKFDIDMMEDLTPLKEVVVESDRDVRVNGMQMGMEKLDIKTMKQMPLVLGETDVMKVVLALPGVQSVGEGTVGINVRGGTTSQNLILYNDATVYNPAHLFGFFSTFNPDILKNVELYKSGINADYGGRLSSVLDVTTREGNMKKFSGLGGISPITGRLTLEGPIVKDRTSLLIGARSTYSDWLLRQLKSKALSNSKASFYDLNLHFVHKFNDHSQLNLSAYQSNDRFKLNSDTLYNYRDQNISLKWKYSFNKKLFFALTSSLSKYQYSLESDQNPVEAFTLGFSIRQFNAKMDFTYFLNPKHTLNGGFGTTHYNISPGNFQPNGAESAVTPDNLQQEQGLESAFYVGDNIEISPKLSVYVGIRLSAYQFLGPRDVYAYLPNTAKEESSLYDTLHYNKGKSIADYMGPEPRVSIRYSLGQQASVKISYNRMRQYIQMLSNTAAISPTDSWKLSDPHVKPQVGDQISLGFYKNLKNNLIETSIEAYYKTMENTLDYKNGAMLLLNHHIETDVVNAHGKAYGAELMVKKSTGKLNGWISYTYSRTLLQTRSPFPSDNINNGKFYPSGFDKPHAVNFIGNYKVNRRFNFSLNMTYSTGRPITLPLAKYEMGGSTRLYYSERNQYRIPDYFRMDFSINVEGNHRIKKLAHSSWTFAVYNLTGRNNAYSVFFRTEKGKINGYKLSVFAQPIPTLTYNFKF